MLALPSVAAACSLLRVEAAKGADLIVYFTRFKNEDNTEGKYKKCRLVKQRRDDTKSFFVTPFRQDANVIVHEDDWPR